MFSFTPTEDQGPGTHSATIRVTDSFDPACSDFETITITVNEVDGENQCPVLTVIGDRTVDELSLLTFTATATDPDVGQTLTFSLDPASRWARRSIRRRACSTSRRPKTRVPAAHV